MRASRTGQYTLAALAALAVVAAAFISLGPGQTAVAQPSDSTSADTCLIDAGASEPMLAPPGGNPCKSCRQSPAGDRCQRISCDPCCWECPGEPYPICSS